MVFPVGADLARASLVQAGVEGFSVANDGTVVGVLRGSPKSSLVWVDRDGKSSAITGSPVENPSIEVALSPDGTRLAFVSTRNGYRANIWVLDLKSGEMRSLTGGLPLPPGFKL